MRLLKQPDELSKLRFTRLGIHGRVAYFQCKHEGGLGVWRVDTLIPSSHERIQYIKCGPIDYVHSTMGRDEHGRAVIYILLMTTEDDLLAVRIHEIEIRDVDEDPIHHAFELGHPPDFSNPFFSVPLHNAALGVGQREEGPGHPRTVFLYDGSIVQGDIPYWRILLDRETCTFAIEEDTVPAVDPVRVGGAVPDDVPRMVSRFPVMIDGAKRRFLRFGLDSRLFVFTEIRVEGKPTSAGEWIPYTERIILDDETDCDRVTNNLVEICSSRQLRETYSNSGHRATAIESRYNLIVDGDVCILRHRTDNRHNHYSRLMLDDERLEYYLVPCGVAEIGRELSVGRMSYTTVTERIAVIAGMEELAVVDLQPQRLAEIAFWAVQKQVRPGTGDGESVSARCAKTGALYDGWSTKKVAELLGYANDRQLI